MIVMSSQRALEGKMKSVLMEFGCKGDNVRIICKCESIEEAGKIAEQSGLGSRWFIPGCCEEVRSEQGVSLLSILKNTDMAFCVDGKNYLAADSDVREMLLR